MNNCYYSYLWNRFITNFLLIFIIIVCEQTSGQYTNNRNNCVKYEWPCKNGECIASDELCDGRTDCRDGSDETAESCIHIRCPKYSFRCAYGACVSGDAECNGKKECADNSDETSISCPGVLQNITLRGNCGDDEFQCTDGPCISIDNACDGKADCKDGSDETVKICASTYCPSFAFRCGYGACINGAAKCDGIKDCYDGSDETPSLCGRLHTTEPPGDVSEEVTRRPPSQTTEVTVPIENGCKLDELPNVLYAYESNPNDNIRPGQYVPNYSSIVYKCRPKHLLVGQPTNFCLNGNWLLGIPSCVTKILANSSPIDSNRCYNSTLIQDSGNCVGLQKRCKNGDCIHFENFCDGVQHCLDGSDEIPESCIHLNCPKFAFRCAYGACIRRDLTCNNKRDCADNSDEAAAVCGRGNVSNYIGNCLNNQFQCGSGECIPIENACDGRQDCSDTSDETVDLCAGRYCPSFAFRCGYGACTSGIAKCNSIIDCLDGSDEVSVLCNNEKFHTETIADNDLSTNVIDSSQFQGTAETFINLTISANQSRDCMIDSRPNLIVIHQATNTTIPIEEPIKEYQPITYRCEENYILDNEVINHCVQGNWMLKHPNCLRRRYCSTELISGKTFQARCMYKGSRVSCTNSIQPGTIAFIECKNGYKKSKDFRQEFISCNEYGQWNYNFDFCQAECGISKDDNNVAPWNVGIYTKLFSRRRKQICSGTIITENIILSTANCFWNSEGQHLYDPKKFTVVVGKYHQRNNADELLQIQNFNISEIYIPSQENSSSIAYQNNIAVLVLNDFIDFNSNIKPICIEWLNSNESLISSNRIGKIPVWNKTNSNNNERINLVEAETVSSTDCIVLINARFGLTTTDNNQYCVMPINNDRICNKDNGGGLIIPYKINNIEKYHLLGLINFDIKLNARNECRANEFLTVTNIQYYADIITNYQLKFRLK